MFEMIDARSLDECVVAIDFGASNMDVATLVDGRIQVWTERTRDKPDAELVQRLVAHSGLPLKRFSTIAVTGGHHQTLPAQIEGIATCKVGELAAIARGGQALATGTVMLPAAPILVVSAGSGTAMVAARGREHRHVTGSGVGGGTLLGLGRLLINTTEPEEIDGLAQRGDANGVDLALRDLVTGAIGTLPPDATAVNFGRVARMDGPSLREDLAAALVTLVGQVVATLAINAARAAQIERIVVTGHLTDMASMRQTMARVGLFFGMPLEVVPRAGYGTVIGALLQALAR